MIIEVHTHTPGPPRVLVDHPTVNEGVMGIRGGAYSYISGKLGSSSSPILDSSTPRVRIPLQGCDLESWLSNLENAREIGDGGDSPERSWGGVEASHRRRGALSSSSWTGLRKQGESSRLGSPKASYPCRARVSADSERHEYRCVGSFLRRL